MTEAERAAQYVLDRSARCRARCERLEGLSGDPDARTALGLAWQSVYLAQLEAGLADVDLCVCSTPPYDPDLLLAN